MKKKKKPIYIRILRPLLVLIIIQALGSYLAIYLSGTVKMLDTNAIHILDQTAENRKITLENNMVQQWANLKEEADKLNRGLGEYLMIKNISIDTFLADETSQEEYLNSAGQSLLYTLRKNAVNGTFLILNGPQEQTATRSLKGVYFRDPDPHNNPSDTSDVVFVRGDSQLSHKMKIPLDFLWSPEFIIGPEEDNDSNFYNKPIKAGEENPEAGIENLGYWSPPFTLEGNCDTDSYCMITYSVPLIYGNRTVYGVLGIDISLPFLYGEMPANEIKFSDGNHGGYLLLSRQQEDSYRLLAGTGAAASRAGKPGDIIRLDKTGEKKFFRLRDIQIYNSQAYGACQELKLYNKNTEFFGEQWAIMAVGSQKNLFGLGSRLRLNLSIAILLTLLIGIIMIYFVASVITRPIRRLSLCIGDGNKSRLSEYKRSNISEIDDLYDEICVLTEIQKRAEAEVREKKERYQAALESSTDTLLEYDSKVDTLYLYNISNEGGKQEGLMEELKDCRHTLETSGIIHKEDKKKLPDFFDMNTESRSIVFRGRMGEKKEEYQWLELKAKAILYDDGRALKIIGSLRNINEKKLKELAEQEKKKRDYLTGLYNRIEGIRRIEELLSAGKSGCLVLLDVDRFKEIDDSLGMVMGDVVLEEIGRILPEQLSDNDIAMRYGGDEFIVWLTQKGNREGEKFCSDFRTVFYKSDVAASLEIKVSIGFAEGRKEPIEAVIKRAVLALKYAKRQGGGVAHCFDSLPENEKQGSLRLEDSYNEIAGIRYEAEYSIVSLVFNMFDKTNDLRKIMPVLLLKTGNYFHLSDIIVTTAEEDFNADYASWQWHRQGETVSGEVSRYQEDEFRECTGSVRDGFLVFSDSTEELTPLLRSFFYIGERMAGLCFPLLIDDNYMGSIAFMDRNTGRVWNDKEKNNLNEIVKIIATNMGRAKSDLASQAKSDFLSRMSHEIRTPMNAIIGMTEIAKTEKNLSEQTRECLKKIEISSEYLLSIINDILDMSKIESGKMKLAVAPMNLERMTEEINTLIRPQAEERGQNFIIQREFTHPVVMGDEMRVNQVIVNLLSNALKFTPAGGRIILTEKQSAVHDGMTDVTFSVEDTGIGISQENSERIFRSFEQAETETASQFGGTGLGLAISSNLVHMMGGKIHLQSEKEKGSRFYFTIRFPNAQEEQKEDERQKQQYDFTGKRILLVEDNELNIEIAQTLLSMRGFEVEPAENGQIAVDKFRQSKPGYYDAILMDIRMPVLDGLEATRAIRKLSRGDAARIPIVAMSANAFNEDMKKSVESGMNGHLVKPIDWEKLNEILGKLLYKEDNEERDYEGEGQK